jgi:hypothetical protein
MFWSKYDIDIRSNVCAPYQSGSEHVFELAGLRAIEGESFDNPLMATGGSTKKALHCRRAIQKESKMSYGQT